MHRGVPHNMLCGLRETPDPPIILTATWNGCLIPLRSWFARLSSPCWPGRAHTAAGTRSSRHTQHHNSCMSRVTLHVQGSVACSGFKARSRHKASSGPLTSWDLPTAPLVPNISMNTLASVPVERVAEQAKGVG